MTEKHRTSARHLALCFGPRTLVRTISAFAIVAIGSSCYFHHRHRYHATAMAQSNSNTTHQQEIAEWRQLRDARCRDPTGWLALAGLAWLDLGLSHIVASSPSSQGAVVGQQLTGRRLEFDAALPAYLGDVHLLSSSGSIEFEAADGIEVRVTGGSGPEVGSAHHGQRVALETDAVNEANPTTIHYDSVSFFIIKRGERFGIRLRDSQAATLRNFTVCY
jgi:uncharacterized protein